MDSTNADCCRKATLLALLLLLASPASLAAQARAVFAGGCFWCMEEAFEKVDGVSEVISGYAGGSAEDANYRAVSAGRTRHAEVVEVRFDPEQVSYRDLLQVFWLNIDPTVKDRQFCDRGAQYRSAIFPADDEQRRLAERSRELLAAQKPFDGPIETAIEPLEAFYPAESYHQDYYRRNRLRYTSYKYGCGRAQRLQRLWGDARQAVRWDRSD